jgi:hypothetical protein
MKSKMRKLKVGEWVQVRSKEEILSTLDSKGQLDGMPFMPEMFAFCGKKFQVYKRAHKTCDTVFPIRGRRLDQAVHLDTRCDGSSHGGCQAGCLIFWKLAWLKPHREATLEGRSGVEDDNASEAQSGSRSTSWLRRSPRIRMAESPPTIAKRLGCRTQPPTSLGGIFVSILRTTGREMWVYGRWSAAQSTRAITLSAAPV